MPENFYPFLESSKERLKRLAINLEDLPKHPVYSRTLDLAADDILESPEFNDEEEELVTFTVAKILLGIAGNKKTAEKYAKKKSEQYRSKLDKEDLPSLITIARELALDVRTEKILQIHVLDFLKNRPENHHLIKAELSRGYVKITKIQLAFVISRAVENQIINSIPKKTGFPKEFVQKADYIKTRSIVVKKTFTPKVSRLNDKAIPPCIKQLLSMLESGSANHNAHFILATFLTGLKLDEGAIVDAFRRSPKFNERTTAYQIRYAVQKGYTCPSCKAIKKYGFCKHSCEKGHPVSQYFLNLRRLKNGTTNQRMRWNNKPTSKLRQTSG